MSEKRDLPSHVDWAYYDTDVDLAFVFVCLQKSRKVAVKRIPNIPWNLPARELRLESARPFTLAAVLIINCICAHALPGCRTECRLQRHWPNSPLENSLEAKPVLVAPYLNAHSTHQQWNPCSKSGHLLFA
jgi:hypothetical protein